MKARLRLALAAALVCAAAPALAQRPTATEAQAILRGRPDLVARLRQWVAGSGLTPDQLRARLRAEGYPESLLDPYLAGVAARGDSLTPTADVFAAVRELGLADSADTEVADGRDAAGAGGDWEEPAPGDDASQRAQEERAYGGRTGPDQSSERDRDAERSARRRGSGVEGEPADSGYAIFGLDVFRAPTTQFDANAAGPVDASYRLGPGDRLVLILTGDVQAAHTLDVARDGSLVVPQVGLLHVANLTLAQLEELLHVRLGRVYSGVRRGAGSTTHFSVNMVRLRANQVFVVGDVARPGSYRVSGAATALTALYAAGGPARSGSLRRVEVRRGGATVARLDLYDYLLRGDASRDVRLQSGDVVFVPVHGPRVRVTGQVVRPATYELLPGESLADLVRGAGGFTPTASRRRVQIERVLAPAQRTSGGRDRVVISLTAEQLSGEHGPAFPLEAGDVVHAFEVVERVRDRVTVVGNVWAPGPQGWAPGMRVSDALRLAGGVKPDVFLGQVLITRLQPDSTRVQLRTSFRDSTGALTEDLALREDDEIQVFSLRAFRPRRYVTIAGAVRSGGRFPYREGMTLRDLALLAGGLEESAYLQEAEIARLPEDRSKGVTATTFRVPLDSSYLFERAPDGRYLGPPGLPAPASYATEVAIRPYDNVLILRQPDWELQRTVVVAGEVRFPGRYALRSKSERLQDVIRRAGGLTAEAYAEGVHFYRADGHLGRIGVDLPRVLREPAHRDNLILQDGDSLFIPAYNAVVHVTGAVNSPVAVAFVPGRDLGFYVRAAGGGSRQADLARAYVTQPNGKVESVRKRVLLPDAVPEPRPGSVVHVPERDPGDKKDVVAAAGAIAQIFASLVAIVVVVAR